MIGLDDVRAAAERIAPYIRSTPVVKATATRQLLADAEVWMKLESLQPTGSFKARGATNRLLTTPRQELAAGIVTASGGNHGLATARAARIAGVTATVFVPETAEQAKIDATEAQPS